MSSRATILVAAMAVCAPGLAQTPAELTNRYCAGCHNDTKRTAGLSLATAPVRDPETWEKAVRKLRTRQMPPPGLPRPSEAQYDALIRATESELDRLAAAKPNPGRTSTFRRLTRTEYHNAIRDLLAVDVDFSPLLPADESSHGFDNITVGQLSPALLEKYLAAARKVSRLAVGASIRSAGGDTILITPDLTQEETLQGLPFGTRGGASIRYNFPLDGEYEFQLRLARDRDERVEGLTTAAHDLELSVDGAAVKAFTAKPPGRTEPHHFVDKDFHVRTFVKAGEREVTATFLKRTASLLETERQPYQSRFNADRHPRTQPALYSISIAGPYDARGAGDTESRRRIFVCKPATQAAEDDCARKILGGLMRRAYRRPVSAAELEMPLRFYRDGRESAGFEAGIETALRALLANPNFLIRVEHDPAGVAPGTAYHVSAVELASRLSFFLWSSIPDEPLLAAAASGELRKPSVLERHVRRMLADPRAKALATNFAAQWLHLRNLDSVNPDPRLYPDFDDNLRQAMRQETELLFESVMREDRDVLDLLRADYTFLNERLAKHYGIPHVYGSHFRRVPLGGGARGGLLTHGSVLTVTSYATRTSPVIRGKWILANLLGAPPSPPPPDIPPLKEKGAAGKALSIREQMAAHRANPACASCHNLMDPAGFALEHFDAVGRWREEDGGIPVDAAGAFPDGTRFEGAAGLQRAVLARPELFVGALTEKLLTYAMGRGLEPYDAPAVRQVLRSSRPASNRFSALILGIVNSTPFQMRRSSQ